MELSAHMLLYSILFILPATVAGITCGSSICLGAGAYCCWKDDRTYGCCWDTYVYQLWWFWLIWVVVFFLILACALACWRRRRVQYRYTVMTNSQYPGYGTVVHTNTTNTSNTTYSTPPGYNVPYGAAPTAYPTPPVGPPSYAATQDQKPPIYGS